MEGKKKAKMEASEWIIRSRRCVRRPVGFPKTTEFAFGSDTPGTHGKHEVADSSRCAQSAGPGLHEIEKALDLAPYRPLLSSNRIEFTYNHY